MNEPWLPLCKPVKANQWLWTSSQNSPRIIPWYTLKYLGQECKNIPNGPNRVFSQYSKKPFAFLHLTSKKMSSDDDY